MALLRRTQEELEGVREFARRVMAVAAEGAQLLGDEAGLGAGSGAGRAAVEQAAAEQPPPVPVPAAAAPAPAGRTTPPPAAAATADDQELMMSAIQKPDATKANRNSKQITVGARALAASCPILTVISLNGTQVTDVGAPGARRLVPQLDRD